VSSDTERKRARPFEPPDLRALPAEAYTPAALAALYDRLATLAASAIESGHTVLIDATFLKQAQRERFAALARALRVPSWILDFRADRARLEARVRSRLGGPRDASDAGEAVLAAQLANAQPLTEQERESTIAFDTDVPIDAFTKREYWQALFERVDSESGG